MQSESGLLLGEIIVIENRLRGCVIVIGIVIIEPSLIGTLLSCIYFSLTLAKINYDERSEEEKILFEGWELIYLWAMVNDTCTCLICNASLVCRRREMLKGTL